MSANPLIPKWTGPYGGLPPFDRAKVEHFKPALEAAMAEHLEEVERIAADPAAPTFENTMAALERAGRALDRVSAVYYVFASTVRTPEFQEVEREMEPKLAAHRDKIVQNSRLFKRIAAVYEGQDRARLDTAPREAPWGPANSPTACTWATASGTRRAASRSLWPRRRRAERWTRSGTSSASPRGT